MRTPFILCLLCCATLCAKDDVTPPDRIQTGYIISIQVLEDKRDAVQQRVAVTGEIQMPYIGLMRAADKTCAELANEARQRLEKTHFPKVTVIVKVDDKSAVKDRIICFPDSPSVTVFGSVPNNGKYDIPPGKDLTVSAQLARAGGRKSGTRFRRSESCAALLKARKPSW